MTRRDHIRAALDLAAIPETVKEFFRIVRPCLEAFAADHGFELRPYEDMKPFDDRWSHGLYGRIGDAPVCLRIRMDERNARYHQGTIQCWIMYEGEKPRWLKLDQEVFIDLPAELPARLRTAYELLRKQIVFDLASAVGLERHKDPGIPN